MPTALYIMGAPPSQDVNFVFYILGHGPWGANASRGTPCIVSSNVRALEQQSSLALSLTLNLSLFSAASQPWTFRQPCLGPPQQRHPPSSATSSTTSEWKQALDVIQGEGLMMPGPSKTMVDIFLNETNFLDPILISKL